MISLEYEMTYTETIDGPLGRTSGSASGDRVCWQVSAASLEGPRISAVLAMPGCDWVRIGRDGLRRQDLRTTLLTHDGELVLFRYDLALIRSTGSLPRRARARRGNQLRRSIHAGRSPQFEVGDGPYAWLTQNLFLGRGRLIGPRQIAYEIYRVL